MKFLILSLLLLNTSNVFAKSLVCKTSLNSKVIMTEKVETVLKEKVPAGKTSFASVYVTEKPGNLFVVEAFIPAYEVRVYGQGVLKAKTDLVSTILWGRELLVDISCQGIL